MTNRQTHYATRSVAIGRIYVVVRCGLIIRLLLLIDELLKSDIMLESILFVLGLELGRRDWVTATTLLIRILLLLYATTTATRISTGFASWQRYCTAL